MLGSQDSKKSDLQSQGTISIDFNDCSSSEQEGPRRPPDELADGNSGPITIGPRKRFLQRDTSSQSTDSSSAESEKEVITLQRAFLEVGVGELPQGRGLACECAKIRRLDVKEIQARAKSVQDKVTRLVRESRLLMKAIRKVMDDDP